MLWDCKIGAPMKMGPEGERYAVEWRPGGRGKPLFVHLATKKTAQICLRTIAKGEADRWGLFEIQVPETTEMSPNGSPEEKSVEGGGGVPALPVITRDMPLAQALKIVYDTPSTVALIGELLQASKPIYSSIDGDQQVVGYEPDWPTRKEGVKIMLGYRDGLPVKKVEEIVHHETTPDEFIERLSRKGYRDAMQQLIDHHNKQDEMRLAHVMEKHRG